MLRQYVLLQSTAFIATRENKATYARNPEDLAASHLIVKINNKRHNLVWMERKVGMAIVTCIVLNVAGPATVASRRSEGQMSDFRR